jgi:hypothetical protein
MSVNRKRFRVEQAILGDAPMLMPEGPEVDVGPMHREIMNELRAIRAQMAAPARRPAETTEEAVNHEIAEAQAMLETYRAQIEQCEKLKVELDLIHDAINRTKREIAVLQVVWARYTFAFLLMSFRFVPFIGSGTGGSSATVKDTVDQAIHGRYADTVSLNLYDDTLLKHHAGWKLNLGTYAGARITRLTLELHRSTSLAAAWAALDIGDRIDLTNLPSNYPPGAEELVLEGYTETIKNFLWTVEANCSPYKPWDVLTIASAFTSRIQTGGSSLAADISATDLSMSVASPVAANLFTTTATFPSDFPLYVYVGGEAIAVTAIVGTTSPQTFTITRSDNGVVKAHRAGDAVTLKFAYPIAL